MDWASDTASIKIVREAGRESRGIESPLIKPTWCDQQIEISYNRIDRKRFHNLTVKILLMQTDYLLRFIKLPGKIFLLQTGCHTHTDETDSQKLCISKTSQKKIFTVSLPFFTGLARPSQIPLKNQPNTRQK